MRMYASPCVCGPQKHKKTMALCSSTRTKKNQRKVEHKARMAAKDAEKLALIASEVVMKDAAPAPAAAAAKKQKAKKKAAKGSGAASMEE